MSSEFGVVTTIYLPGKGNCLEEFKLLDSYDEAVAYRDGLNDGFEACSGDHLTAFVIPEQLEYLEDSVQQQVKEEWE